MKYFIIESISFQEKIERQEKSMSRTETIEKIAELLSTQSIRVCEAIYKAAKNISEPQEEKGGAR